MEPRSDRRGRRRTFSVAVRLVILVAASVISYGNGCSNLLNPVSTTQTGLQQCASAGALYCNSYVIPQTLSYGVPGGCCATTNNASVGYLCAYGASKVAPGCFNTSDDAWNTCTPTYGQPSSVVRCTR